MSALTTELPNAGLRGIIVAAYATTAALPAGTYANGTVGVGATFTVTAHAALPAQDGVTPVAGDVILVKDQASGLQNGVYTLTTLGTGSVSAVLTRHPSSNTAAKISGCRVHVIGGAVGANLDYGVNLLSSAITVGTTALAFAHQSDTGYLDAGNSGAAKTIDWTLASFQKLIVTANTTLTFTPPAAGTEVELYLVQDVTGARTVTLPATVTPLGGASFQVNAAPGATSIFRATWTGTEYRATMPIGSAAPSGQATVPANTVLGSLATAAGIGNTANGYGSRVGGSTCRTGNVARTFTIPAGGTLVTIAGDVTAEFPAAGHLTAIVPKTPAIGPVAVITTASPGVFASGNTTFSLSSPIDGATTGGLIVDQYSGLYSVAEGLQCVAAGPLGQSRAWGFNNQALGTASTAFGGNCVASGDNAVAWGEACVASGIYSTAFGNGTISRGAQAAACGVSNSVLGSDGVASFTIGINCAAYGPYSRCSGRTSAVWGTAGDCSGDTCLSTGRAAFATGTSCRAGNLVSAFTIAAGGTLVTIAGDVTAAFTNGDAVVISPTAPTHLAAAQGTINSVPAFAAGNTTFNLLAAIDATTTGGSIVDETQGKNAFSIGASSVASAKQTFAHGDGAVSKYENEEASAGGAFSVAGDAQQRRIQVKCSTPGSGAGETAKLLSGSATVIALEASRSYHANIRGVATKMGLSGGTRQSFAFWKAFEVDVTAAGAVTVSAVASVHADIVTGAAFVGATVVPASPGANQLNVTFSIAGGLTIASRVKATLELDEVLGT